MSVALSIQCLSKISWMDSRVVPMFLAVLTILCRILHSETLKLSYQTVIQLVRTFSVVPL